MQETLPLVDTCLTISKQKGAEMGCKGFCQKLEVKKINPKGSGMYKLGYKLCSTCEKFIDWEEQQCPCCGTRLRSKPRGSKDRRTFVDI